MCAPKQWPPCNAHCTALQAGRARLPDNNSIQNLQLHSFTGGQTALQICRQDEFSATGVSGELYSTIDKALDERTIGHNPERLCLLKV